MRASLLLAVFLVLTGCQGEEVYTAKVVLAEIKLRDKSTLSGFACSTSDGRLTTNKSRALLARAFTVSETDRSIVVLRATMVMDYVSLGGYPRCRATEIVNYCTEEGHSCKPVSALRTCIDLDPLEIPIRSLGEAVDLVDNAGQVFADYVKERLAGQVFTDDAPDTESILRLVGTVESCEEIEARGDLAFEPEALLGCSYSCPLVPSAARGEILLDFEGIGACENDVVTCSSNLFAPRSQREVPGIPGTDSSP